VVRLGEGRIQGDGGLEVRQRSIQVHRIVALVAAPADRGGIALGGVLRRGAQRAVAILVATTAAARARIQAALRRCAHGCAILANVTNIP